MESSNNNNIIKTDHNNKEDNSLANKNSSTVKVFPRYIIGNIVQEENDYLSVDEACYLELDSKGGTIKRYTSISNYPNAPTDTYDINNLKSLIKLKKEPNCHTFQLNIEHKGALKTHIFKVRHVISRMKWFDSIRKLYLHYKKEQLLVFNNDTLFIDDILGFAHYVSKYKRHNTVNVKEKPKRISINDFDILHTLGYGAFSTVFKVKHTKSGKIYAMKVMDKNIVIEKKHLHYVMTEFNILKRMSNCPFLLQLHCAFQSVNYLFLIVDYCSQGDLVGIESIKNKRLLYAELFLAFEHLHQNNVIYRDLKPENILLTEHGHIKLCDFNLSKEEVQNNEKAYSFCGSLLYLSPETAQIIGTGKASDIFGIGLVMYEIETGVPALYSESVAEIYEKIRNADVDFIQIKDKNCIDLLTKILLEDEKDRLTIQDIKKHRYFNKINWNKVWSKEHGRIRITKSVNNWRAQLDDKEQKHMLNIKKIKKKELIRDSNRTKIADILDFYYVSNEFEKEITD